MAAELKHFFFTDYQLNQIIKYANKLGAEVECMDSTFYTIKLYEVKFNFGECISSGMNVFATVNFTNHAVCRNVAFNNNNYRWRRTSYEMMGVEDTPTFINELKRAYYRSLTLQRQEKTRRKEAEIRAIMED